MATSSRAKMRRSVLAAYAIALAATVGTPSGGQTAEHEAIQKVGFYCDVSWQNASIPRQEWADCTQQVFIEFLAVLPKFALAVAVEEPDSLARSELRRAVWRVAQRFRRRRREVQIVDGNLDNRVAGQSALGEDRDVVDWQRWQRVESVIRNHLTRRQRVILKLVARGWSNREIAAVMQTSTQRVSDQKSRALARIRAHFGIGAPRRVVGQA